MQPASAWRMAAADKLLHLEASDRSLDICVTFVGSSDVGGGRMPNGRCAAVATGGGPDGCGVRGDDPSWHAWAIRRKTQNDEGFIA